MNQEKERNMTEEDLTPVTEVFREQDLVRKILATEFEIEQPAYFMTEKVAWYLVRTTNTHENLEYTEYVNLVFQLFMYELLTRAEWANW